MSLTSEFQNLQEKLRPLNLYALSGDTTVDAELKAYAAGINIINQELETLEREAFVSTALTYGLTEREKIVGGIKVGTEVQNRRDMLNYRSSITANDFSKSNIEKDMIACGLDTTVIENFDGETIAINCHGILNDFTTQDEAVNAAQEFLPAHLNALFDFRVLTWDYIDELENTFNEMDNADMTWDEIDSYQAIL